MKKNFLKLLLLFLAIGLMLSPGLSISGYAQEATPTPTLPSSSPSTRPMLYVVQYEPRPMRWFRPGSPLPSKSTSQITVMPQRTTLCSPSPAPISSPLKRRLDPSQHRPQHQRTPKCLQRLSCLPRLCRGLLEVQRTLPPMSAIRTMPVTPMRKPLPSPSPSSRPELQLPPEPPRPVPHPARSWL